jgi:MFS family permease
MQESQRAGAALRAPAFRWYVLARLAGSIGFQMQGVAVAWQVYDITRDPLHLGYVGLAQFLPMFGLTLPAGLVADRYPRRAVLLLCHLVLGACAAALCVIATERTPSVLAIYATLAMVGLGRAFSGAAMHALVPNLVPRADFTNAVAWSATVWHAATLVGPALGGIAYAWADRPLEVYGVAAALQLIAASAVSALKPLHAQKRVTGMTPADFSAGLRYVYARKIILGSVTLDMFAVLLGGAVALLPVYARDILGVGPSGLGALRSAPAVGAVAMAMVLARFPVSRRAGAILLASVAVFGVATVGFGVSRSFSLSFIMLLLGGAADMVSVYIRHAVVQLATPDELRGRVAAINLAFIGASNELGELESGATAAWLGTVPAVVAGGVGTMVVVLLWTLLFRELRNVDRLDEESLAPRT